MSEQGFYPRVSKRKQRTAVLFLIPYFLFAINLNEPYGYLLAALLIFVLGATFIPGKKFAVILKDGMIQGFDIVNYKRVSIPIAEITDFGIWEKAFKPSLNMHFNFHRRFYAEFSTGRIEAVLQEEDLQVLMSRLKAPTN
jgi:hypothetical protein